MPPLVGLAEGLSRVHSHREMERACAACPMFNACQQGGLVGQDASCLRFISDIRKIVPDLAPRSQSGAQVDYFPCCYLADLLCRPVDADWQGAFDVSASALLHSVGGSPKGGASLCELMFPGRRTE